MSTLSVETIKSLAASTPPVVQDSAGTQIGTFCRAWVNFNGTFASSPFTIANGGIRAGFNVGSVTDNGLGDYTINFTTAMTNASYAIVITCDGTTNQVSTEITSQTAIAARFKSTRESNGVTTMFDATILCCAVFN